MTYRQREQNIPMESPFHMKNWIVFFAFGFCVLPLHASDIYRWVDENGRVQLSDRVPDQFKKSAIRIDSRQFELTPEQRQQAQARAAAEKSRAAEADAREASSRAAEAGSTPPPNSLNSRAPVSRPTVGSSTCAALRQAWKDSAACFAPFQNRTGLKPGAYEACGAQVPYPDTRECAPEAPLKATSP